ncbi:hypothetical protein Back11_59990 [Paenibacillus baekrokdamisoli]|uniref:Uncharacterized protein n=1 Tax=Paenibacillus baekrokdamisoli TaxID=1712516 RepID=A0A3G9JP67_9BACL|nr:hypothetical protein [Paenibacillus baekrokdamisoli]BBH24654.1 hypothetical protein Back11_59990 [Paenibacillus baekrokdamisoli]
MILSFDLDLIQYVLDMEKVNLKPLFSFRSLTNILFILGMIDPIEWMIKGTAELVVS